MGQGMEVNGTFFKTKTALTKAIQKILHADRVGSDLNDSDTDFLVDLVARYHPDPDSKIGCGVKRMWRDRNEYNGVGFYLERIDGTTTDFSFKKCLNPPTHAQKVEKAARFAVLDQIGRFKMKSFEGDKQPVCLYTKVILSPNDCHVDHEPPRTFQNLFRVFLKITERNIDLIKLRPRGDNSVYEEFEDKELERHWQAWHEANAKLRVLSRRGNLSDSKRIASA
jgi:hypothetical protein